MVKNNKETRKRDVVFADNSVGGADTGLLHGLTKAQTRAETGQAFYDSNYDTTLMANRKVHAESLQDAQDTSEALNQPISLAEALRRSKVMNTNIELYIE